MSESYDLGSITCPSGILVVLDLGYLGLWSGSSEPQPHFNGSESAEIRAAMASMRDYQIVGPDAARLGEIADKVAICSFRYLYDIPESGRDAFFAGMDDIAAKNGLDAHIEPEPAPVPHRIRAQRAAEGANSSWKGFRSSPSAEFRTACCT